MATRVLSPKVEITFYDVTGGGASWKLTDLLGEGCSLTWSYSVRQAAGSFQIVIADDSRPLGGESPYYWAAPMDGIEIRASHDDSNSLPLVFRGFVSEVRREEVMGSDGTPERRTIISGQSIGKVLLLQQIYYVIGADDAEHYMTPWKFFSKYKESAPKLKPVADFVAEVVSVVLQPHLSVLDAASAMRVSITPDVRGVRGIISPYDVCSFQDRSCYELLAQLCDVGPFNELYVEDVEGGSKLILRPNQFYTADGDGATTTAHEGVAPERIVIDHRDLVALSVGRSDACVSNLFWVSVPQTLQSYHITRFEMYDRVARQIWDIRKSHPRALESLYGYRKMEVSARRQAPDMLTPDAPKEGQIPPEKSKYGSWMTEMCLSLREQNKDNVIFEQGTMTLRGNEKIKAGMYVTLARESVKNNYYAVTVTNHLQAYGNWTTQVQFERGTSMITRSSKDYAGELRRDGGAVR